MASNSITYWDYVFPSIVSQLSQLPKLAMHSGTRASGSTSGKVSSMCCGYLVRYVPCCEVCRRARVRVCLCTSGEEVWAPHVSLTVSITLGLTKVYNGREWSLASRLIENCFIALYAIPHSVANPFYLWCGRPWYTCLELVEITFGEKERETANLEGPLAWQVLSLSFSHPLPTSLSHLSFLSFSLSHCFSSIFPVISRSRTSPQKLRALLY